MANKIKIDNVRLSFPSLFKKAEFNGQVGKFEASVLISKETQAAIITKIEAIIDAECVGAKIKRPAPDKVCLRDGDHQEYDGYAGMMSLKAASSRRPTIIDRDKTPLIEEDGVVYAGCYVNIVVDFWVQNNNYGKRVNCNLLGVQFAKEGDSFGAGDTNVESDFDDLSDI